MDHLCKLVIGGLLALLSFGAYAQWSNLAPVSGWAPAPTLPGGGTWRKIGAGVGAANAGTWATSTATSVGGRMITVPTTMRMAANAGTFAISALRATPTGLISSAVLAWVATAGIQWLNDQWVVPDGSQPPVANRWWSHDQGPFGTPCKTVTEQCTWTAMRAAALEYVSASNGGARYDEFIKECNWYSGDAGNPAATVRYRCTIEGKLDSVVNGNVVTSTFTHQFEAAGGPGGTDPAVTYRPANDTDWSNVEPLLGYDPAAEALVQLMPLPMDLPEVSPLRVPVGDPVPVPNTNPQEWVQPVTDIIPRPTQSEPWRVQIIPGEIPSDATGLQDPVVLDGTDPASTPRTPEQKQLCEVYPEVLACADMDTPEAEDLEQQDREITITPDTGWGASGGSCPAPYMAGSIPIPFDLVCMYMEGIRPIVIGLAWLSAAFIVIGGFRSE